MDGAHFLDLLAEGTARFGFRRHGYCLMPNHVHLMLQAGAAPLSRAMQNLSFRHTRRINARETGAPPLSALAARFGRDLSSYGGAVRRIEEKAASDKSLQARIEAINNAIMQA